MRNTSLDASRALLAWGIVAIHIAWLSGLHNAQWHWAGVWIVNAFVLISGYCIAGLLLYRKENLIPFLVRRFLRLAPAYYAALGLAIALRPLSNGLVPADAAVYASENAHWWKHVGWHLVMLQNFSPLPFGAYTILTPAWSTALEWSLYGMAIPLLWLLVRTPRCLVWPAIALGFALGVLGTSERLAIPAASPLARIGFFAAGMLLTLVELPKWRLPIPAWLGAEGRRSYSVFLIHYPLLACVYAGCPRDWAPSDKASILVVAGIPLITFASEGLHTLIEMPFINFAKKLCRKDPEIRTPPDLTSSSAKAKRPAKSGD